MRTYNATVHKKRSSYHWGKPILGLFCLGFLVVPPFHLAAQAIQEIPSTGPEESLHEEQAAPATTPEVVPGTAPAATVSAVPETVPTSIPEQGLFTEFFLPPAREGMGAESWYYEAKRLEQADQGGAPSQEKQALLDHMYSLAFHFGEKTAAIEAGKTLLQRSLSRTGYHGTKNLALQWLEYFGPDWEVYRILISRALESADYPQALEAVAAMRRLLPATAKARAAELSFYEFSARAGLGEQDWVPAALAYLDAATLDSWGAKLLRLAAAAGSLEHTINQ